MFSIADRHHDKNNVGKKEFIWLTCSDQRLSLREVWARNQAGAESENIEKFYCLAQLTYTTSDQFDGVKAPTVGWGLPHDSTRK